MQLRFLSLLFLSITSIVPFMQSNASIAKSISPAISCQTRLTLANGDNLIYRINGTIANRRGGPSNLMAPSLNLTVQRRDRNGRIQTLLQNTPALDYEQSAPDADYSYPPFSPGFRGKPSDGLGLYRVNAAKDGLYISLRQPNKIQVVHYLSAGKPVRSEIGQCK